MYRISLGFLLLTFIPSLEAGIDFESQVLPVLKQKCFRCHSQRSTRPKGDLVLDDLEKVIQENQERDLVVAGQPAESYLFQRITAPKGDELIMPPEAGAEPLTRAEIALIGQWIQEGGRVGIWTSQDYEVDRPFDHQPRKISGFRSAARRIDRLIERKLDQVGQKPNRPIDDAAFVRRVYLDVCGRIPTYQEATRFLNSREKDKREKLIEELVGSEGYVSHSFNLWADALRVKSSTGRTDGKFYLQWIKDSLRENKPYDQFVRELITAQGILWKNGATGFHYRDEGNTEAKLESASELFLGTQIGCAQCHDHPYDVWTRKQYWQMRAYFDGVRMHRKGDRGAFAKINAKELGKKISTYRTNEVVKPRRGNGSPEGKIWLEAFTGSRATDQQVWYYHRGGHYLPEDYQYDDGKPKAKIPLDVLFGKAPQVAKEERPADAFARWLSSAENVRFTQTIVNRLWGNLFGHPLSGADTEVVDLSDAPHPELVRALMELMVDLEFDLQRFLIVLLNTEAYQREMSPELDEGTIYYFNGPVVRRLSAEQLWDSVLALFQEDLDEQISRQMPSTERLETYRNAGSIEEFWSLVKERVEQKKNVNPGPKYREQLRQIKKYGGYLPDQLIRASEMRSPAPDGHFLMEFGQSDRELIDNRTTSSTVPQALTLLNGPLFELIIDQEGSFFQLMKRQRSPDSRIRTIYLKMLTREPTSQEKQIMLEEIDRPEGMRYDVAAWALLNSSEFLFQH